MKDPRSIWVAVAMIGAAGAIVGASAASGSDVPEPETAATYYGASLSPEEISTLSQGRPGEVAPPCPAADVVTDLKEKGLQVGPCVPVPEKGHPVVLPLEDDTDDAASTQEVCAGVFLRSTTPDGPNKVQGPCGVGASISDVELFVDKDGTDCATVTYATSKAAAPKTDRVCEGDQPTADGLALLTEVR